MLLYLYVYIISTIFILIYLNIFQTIPKKLYGIHPGKAGSMP